MEKELARNDPETGLEVTHSRLKACLMLSKASVNINQSFQVVDSHTAGMPTRVLIEGSPTPKGRDMSEKKDFFRKNFDFVRTTLMQEPRGNSGMAAVLVPPSSQEADYGVIFGDFSGYVDMCIHGTIGLATTLVELGYVNAEKARRGLVFDTPAGLVRTKANISGGRVKSVTVRNVPSFTYTDRVMDIPSLGKIPVSFAFGGNNFAYVNSSDLRLELDPSRLGELLAAGRLLLREVKRLIRHPVNGVKINGISGVSIVQDFSPRHAKNIMIAENDLFDRSPCGTGTCGRMAILNSNGRLKKGERFINESIIDSKFVGRIADFEKMDGHKAIVPEITGTAYLTAISDILVSNDDRLSHGFLVA
ncbi:MAG: proline racemase family protein [Thaumarchaeota archaeon]|nr:proline racemase family protein [Nitrososphaerota archaeon]